MQTPTAPTTALPRKSRWRWYILGFLLLVAATPVTWYFVAGWLGERAMAELLAEMDAEDPSWRWADVVGKMEPIPDEANSVAQIVKVRALARTPGTFNPGPKWDNAEPLQNARLTDDQVNALQTAFSRCDPTLRDEARKLKDLPRGRFSISAQGNPFDFDYEELQISRTVVYVLQIDAALRAHEGDLDGATESCEAILNTAGAFKDHPSLIGFLVRAAEQAIAIHAIERLLGQGTVSEPQLKKLQELLQREADDDGLYSAIRGERAAAHQMYLNVRDGKTTISQVLGNLGRGDDPGLTGRLLDVFPNVILKDYPDYLRTMNANVRACKLEPELRAGDLEKIDQSVRTDGNMLSRMMLPGIVKVAEASRRTQANLRCAIVAVAAERYRLSKGAWPPTLDELVKDGLLAKVPTDPYDGKPLRWKRTPTGAVAYSVGRDKIDNGGNLNRANVMADGADFGFELWDPRMRGMPPPVEDK
jgi:competence protein ComGC